MEECTAFFTHESWNSNRKKIVSLNEVSLFWLFFYITKKHLLGTNLAVEYKNGRKHKYIKLRKNKVIVNVQIREYI